MTILKRIFNKLWHPIDGIVYLFLALSLVGFSDATFLTFEHYRGALPSCGLIVGCHVVLQSAYASFENVPLALFGSIFYLFIIFSALLYLGYRAKVFLRFISWLTIPGFLASLYFLYLQIFTIHALCQYCLGSLVTATLLFICGLRFLTSHKSFVAKI